MAKKTNLNVSVGVDTTAYRKGWEEVAKITVAGGQQTEKEAEKMVNAMTKKFEKLSLKQQIRQFEQLAAKMEQTGQAGTKAFSDVIKKTGDLKAAQDDLKGLIDASRPDAPFKSMQNALQGAANAYAGVQGAMQLFGAESEDTQKALLKVQAAMAFAQGFEAIDQLSDSFQQLNLVIKQNPLIAVAAGIATAVAAYAYLSQTVDNYAAVTEKANAKNQEEIATMTQLRNAINSNVISEADRNAAIDEAIKAAPEYLGNLDKHRTNLEYINTAIGDYISLLGMQARAEATKEIYVEKLKEQLKAEQDVNEMRKKGSTWAIGGPAAVENKASELKKEAEVYEKQYNIIANTVRLEQERLKALHKLPDKATLKHYADVKKQIEDAINKQKELDAAMAASVYGIKQQDIKGTKPFYKMDGGPLQMPEPRKFKISADHAAELAKQNREVALSAQEMNAALNSASADGLANMATAIGTAIATGQDLGQAIGKSFLTSLADFLQQMGKMMITTASIWSAFQKALVAQPELAIALGFAAVGASAALRAHVQNGAKPEAFASGGMVNSPTFALIGDNLNAHNNPEFVLRQDQLTKMLGSGGSFQPIIVPIVDSKGISVLVEDGNRRRNR